MHDPADHPPIIKRAPGRFFGSNGSIAAHCPSLNQNSFAIVKPPLQSLNLICDLTSMV
jgi:hypothetical protein